MKYELEIISFIRFQHQHRDQIYFKQYCLCIKIFLTINESRKELATIYVPGNSRSRNSWSLTSIQLK